MKTGENMAEAILNQAKKESGWHSSPSDDNEHLTVKNSNGLVIGHIYKDGTINGTNNGGSGALSWLLK